MATVFSVRARAGKGSFSVSLAAENPLAIKAEIPAIPQGGKANRALVLGLEKLLGCRVSLLSGQTGRKKTLSAECEKEEMIKKIKEIQR